MLDCAWDNQYFRPNVKNGRVDRILSSNHGLQRFKKSWLYTLHVAEPSAPQFSQLVVRVFKTSA